MKSANLATLAVQTLLIVCQSSIFSSTLQIYILQENKFLQLKNSVYLCRRRIYDEYNDEEVVLTKEETKIIHRLLSGRTPHSDVNPYEVCIQSCFHIFYLPQVVSFLNFCSDQSFTCISLLKYLVHNCSLTLTGLIGKEKGIRYLMPQSQSDVLYHQNQNIKRYFSREFYNSFLRTSR